MIKGKKWLLLILLILLINLSLGQNSIVYAYYAPSYNYSYWGDSVAAPDAYEATQIIDGKLLGVGSLKEPNDILFWMMRYTFWIRVTTASSSPMQILN